MSFNIGQIFPKETGYPPEAADWCNLRGDCYIEETSGGFCIKEIPKESSAEIAKRVRLYRNSLLRETDFYMLPDYPSDPNTIESVKEYRKNLRDISNQIGFPEDVVWPVVPKIFCKEHNAALGLAKVGI